MTKFKNNANEASQDIFADWVKQAKIHRKEIVKLRTEFPSSEWNRREFEIWDDDAGDPSLLATVTQHSVVSLAREHREASFFSHSENLFLRYFARRFLSIAHFYLESGTEWGTDSSFDYWSESELQTLKTFLSEPRFVELTGEVHDR